MRTHCELSKSRLGLLYVAAMVFGADLILGAVYVSREGSATIIRIVKGHDQFAEDTDN